MFFQPLRRIVRFFELLNQDLIVFDILLRDDELKAEILDLNKIDQLFEKGIDTEGRIIGLYSRFTEILSDGRKKAFTPYTLLDTGEFYDSFKLVPASTFFEIIADPMKDGVNIFEELGNDFILGLTEDSKDKLVAMLIPKIQDFVQRNLPQPV